MCHSLLLDEVPELRGTCSQSVLGDVVEATTTNAGVRGNFNASMSLKLNTSNAPIEVNTVLTNAEGDMSTELVMRTQNWYASYCLIFATLSSLICPAFIVTLTAPSAYFPPRPPLLAVRSEWTCAAVTRHSISSFPPSPLAPSSTRPHGRPTHTRRCTCTPRSRARRRSTLRRGTSPMPRSSPRPTRPAAAARALAGLGESGRGGARCGVVG